MKPLPLFAKFAVVGVLLLGLLQMLDDHPDNKSAAMVQAIVATPAREFAATLDPSGKRIYFNRSSEMGSWHIWVTDYSGESVAAASPVAFSDDRYDDLDPFVSRNGDRLYFSSDRPLPGSTNEDRTVDTNTWFSPWAAGAWGAPVYAGDAINTRSSETYVSESASGELVFARFGEGRGRARPAFLMSARRTEYGFAAPVQIATLPDGLRLTNPAISPDGRLLVAAGTQGGGPSLYFSRRSDTGDWSEFKLLPSPVNIDGSGQFAPYITNDGEWLYFGSDRNSAGEERNDDIFRVPLKALLTE